MAVGRGPHRQHPTYPVTIRGPRGGSRTRQQHSPHRPRGDAHLGRTLRNLRPATPLVVDAIRPVRRRFHDHRPPPAVDARPAETVARTQIPEDETGDKSELLTSDFKPVSYGLPPGRRTQDAIAEIRKDQFVASFRNVRLGGVSALAASDPVAIAGGDDEILGSVRTVTGSTGTTPDAVAATLVSRVRRPPHGTAVCRTSPTASPRPVRRRGG